MCHTCPLFTKGKKSFVLTTSLLMRGKKSLGFTGVGQGVGVSVAVGVGVLVSAQMLLSTMQAPDMLPNSESWGAE